ncbi:MAG: hypothetical protein ABMB14_26480 [Myxococcota bacterium]
MRSVTFLQLAPEFGGTKFGPFDGVEIRLGSDPGASDITLPETLGVAAQHVKVLRQQDSSFIIAPVDRAAPVFHFRAGTARPKQVTAPLAVQSGDAFSLVTPEGPRFVIVAESDPRTIRQATEEASGPRLSPNAARMSRGLMAEIRRRGLAAVFSSRLGNMWMKTWTMIRSGSIFSPVYIVSGMFMLSGWLFAGSAACSAFRLNRSKGEFVGQLSNCRDQLGVAKDDNGDLTEPTVPDLTKVVLTDGEWARSLEADKELYEAYAQALREVYAEPLKYRWVYTKKDSAYTAFKGALESQGLPPALARVFSFAAASPTWDRPWTLVNDSEAEESCGRGVLGLTYRQAKNLGLGTLQPDALVDRQVAESSDVAKKRAELDATLRDAGAEYTYRDDLILSVGAEVQGGLMCLYVDGTDDRSDLSAIAAALKAKVGANVTRNLPREGEQNWIAARLMMFFAQEFKAYELEQVSFGATMAPSIAMSTKNVKETRRKFAVREAARLMARAAAIPCLGRFDKEQREIPSWFMAEPPKVGACAILRAYVEYDRL